MGFEKFDKIRLGEFIQYTYWYRTSFPVLGRLNRQKQYATLLFLVCKATACIVLVDHNTTSNYIACGMFLYDVVSCYLSKKLELAYCCYLSLSLERMMQVLPPVRIFLFILSTTCCACCGRLCGDDENKKMGTSY